MNIEIMDTKPGDILEMILSKINNSFTKDAIARKRDCSGLNGRNNYDILKEYYQNRHSYRFKNDKFKKLPDSPAFLTKMLFEQEYEMQELLKAIIFNFSFTQEEKTIYNEHKRDFAKGVKREIEAVLVQFDNDNQRQINYNKKDSTKKKFVSINFTTEIVTQYYNDISDSRIYDKRIEREIAMKKIEIDKTTRQKEKAIDAIEAEIRVFLQQAKETAIMAINEIDLFNKNEERETNYTIARIKNEGKKQKAEASEKLVVNIVKTVDKLEAIVERTAKRYNDQIAILYRDIDNLITQSKNYLDNNLKRIKGLDMVTLIEQKAIEGRVLESIRDNVDVDEQLNNLKKVNEYKEVVVESANRGIDGVLADLGD